VVSLEKIVATDLPVIPVFYGVAWFEYNTSKFTGWPTPSNPYAPGEPSGPFNEITVLRLRPVS
jgi:peptide/nickel transport system substrate-binding protein